MAQQITPPIVAVPSLICPSPVRQRQVPRAAPPSVAQEPVPPALILSLETSTHDLHPALPSSSPSSSYYYYWPFKNWVSGSDAFSYHGVHPLLDMESLS